MTSDVMFTLIFENGHTKTFNSLVEANEYLDGLHGFQKPWKLIKRETIVRTTTVRSW